ncbi:MAG: indolepyruvate ferredoxin oxidoreductase family protein, partial [Limnobacter sp.]|nr:indolepyruvate ferredoxin oxidoreductase family protein [Limnobacter sp.]
KHLEPWNVHFQPGLNEDLAATSIWGSQQVNLFQGARYDGVFGMWYGKGPGVDRSMDVFKHANAAGTSKHGGVLVVTGDDHGAKSSTLPHQSDHVLKAAMMPVLFPSNLQEYLDLGLLGFAMSRYAGVWVGFKAVADTVESSASVFVDPARISVRYPTDFELPAGGLNIRWPDAPLDQEARLLDQKLYAALAFARANHINHKVIDSPNARFGIVASGKAYRDTLQALQDLGLTPQRCSELGIRLFKVGMVWPLDATGIRDFAKGLQEILVVEEKRQMIEYQIKEELYAWREDVRPKVYGKYDERASQDGREGGEWSVPQGKWLLPTHYELDPATIAKAIARRLGRFELPQDVRKGFSERIKTIRRREEISRLHHAPVERKPHFCSGCPHNTSTKVPEGSRSMAGIGCHYMAVWMNRNTETFTQMGGEGVPWIGQAPFTSTQHVFANLGDGTYFHSGILAIRASVAAKVNITYKLLYNDAVAMTGGQKLDGSLTVPQLSRQLHAEQVSQIVVVTDDLSRYRRQDSSDPLAPGVQVFDRHDLDRVQKQLREVKGTSVLIYEQTCAAEKRRRRKRTDPVTGQPGYPNPLKRVVINPRVCEGCGDCSKQSNCLSIAPLETPWGRKRTIDQSTCNKDYSCLQGLCPSLVTVEQADLATHSHDPDFQRFEQVTRHLEPPRFVQGPEVLHERYSILIDGVGGTGVVTIGAWLGMAAHLQGFEVSVLDMAGLAQKGGAVFSHVQLAPPGQELAAPKIPVGEADFLLGGDEIVSASPSTLEILKDTAKAVVNVDTPPTADLIGNRDWAVPIRLLNDDLEKAIENPAENLFKVSAQKAMHDLLGDTVFANAFLLGVSWQMGAIPLHQSSLQKAIELNAVQVKANWMAFQLGRLAFADPPRFQALLETEPIQEETVPMAIERMAGELVAYQSEALALRFENKVEAWVPVLGRNSDLHLDYASTYYRLLAFKDEYEVARLLSDSAWQHEVLSGFEKGAQLKFHFAPSWLAGHDRPKKRSFGRGVTPFLWLLAKGKVIRGSWLDPFRNTQERRDQRKLVDLFEAWQPSGDPKQTQTVLKLFNQVKGFGQVRAESFKLVVQELLDFCSPNSRTSANGQDRKQNGQEEIKTG